MASPKPLPLDQKRRYRVGVWLSELELFELERRTGVPNSALIPMSGTTAERKQFTLFSRFLRDAALGVAIPPHIPQVNLNVYASLAPIGNNINQIARALNANTTDRIDPVLLQELVQDLQTVRQLLIEVRQEVIGNPERS